MGIHVKCNDFVGLDVQGLSFSFLQFLCFFFFFGGACASIYCQNFIAFVILRGLNASSYAAPLVRGGCKGGGSAMQGVGSSKLPGGQIKRIHHVLHHESKRLGQLRHRLLTVGISPFRGLYLSHLLLKREAIGDLSIS
jgi:hypothetical protein